MEIALNSQSLRKTAAAIAFRDGDRIFGEDALTIGLRFPGNSFQYIMDLLGKTIDNPVVEQYKYVFAIILVQTRLQFDSCIDVSCIFVSCVC